MTRALVLRFDIDTYRCIKEGVPNLLNLAREAQVRFTFFCNMGRAISRPHLLWKLFGDPHPRDDTITVDKLPVSIKLGYYQLLLTLLINPRVGLSHSATLRRARNEGHDIGLHGGRNHGAWQHGFLHWNHARIRREVAAGVAMYKRALGREPVLFSSPGWQGSAELNGILKSFGFAASADRHGADENEIVYESDFRALPTNLVAEPGGVAYFESFAARNRSEKEVVEAFQDTLSDGRSLYVLYDHPCYAGIRGLSAVRQVVQCAIENDVDITTFSALMERGKSPQ